VVNAEVVLFGGSLGKHHVASVELDSDQVRMNPASQAAIEEFLGKADRPKENDVAETKLNFS
jgi:hypothetical protein